MKRVTQFVGRIVAHGSFKNIIGTTVTNVAILALNMATGILSARWLLPAGRGELAAIIMWPQFLAYALAMGIPTSLVYHMKKFKGDGNRYFTAALVVASILGFLATIIGMMIVPQALAKYPADVAAYCRYTMLMAPLILVNLVASAALQSRESLNFYNWVRIATPAPLLALLALLYVLGWMTPKAAAFAYLISGVPSLIWTMLLCLRFFRIDFAGLPSAIRAVASYGMKFSGNDLAGTIAAQVDRIVVIGFLSPVDMGLYAVALSLSRAVAQLQSSVATVLFPRVTGREIEEALSELFKGAVLTTLLTGSVAVPIIIFARELLNSFYGSDFIAAVSVFQVLIIESLLAGAVQILMQAFTSTGRPGVASGLQVVGLAINFPFLMILVPRYGIMGAALSLLLSTLSRLVFVLIGIKRLRPGRGFLSLLGQS